MARKKKKPRRSSPAAQAGAATQGKSRKGSKGGSPLLLWGVLIVVIIAGAYFSRFGFSGRPGESVPSMGNRHIPFGTGKAIKYNSDPPTSGPHYGSLPRQGIHAAPVPKGHQIHHLEDGGIMVQYNCSDCPELIEKLAGIVGRYSRHVILAPYAGMKTRIALTAWGRIETFEKFDEKRITRFIDAYIGLDHHAR